MRRLVAGLLGVSLVASACSNVTEPAEPETAQAAQSTSATTPSASPTSESPSIPKAIGLDSSWRYSSGSVVRNCPPLILAEYADGPLEVPSPSIFDPKTAESVEIVPPNVPGGTELLEVGCLPSGTGQNPGVSIRMYLRTPPKGLDPETFESVVYTYTLDSRDDPIVATLDYPERMVARQGFMGGTGGNLLYTLDDPMEENSALRLIEADGTLIREYPNATHELEYIDEDIFVLRTASVNQNRESVFEAYDGKTGEAVEFASGVGQFAGTWSGGFIIRSERSSFDSYVHTVIDTEKRRAYEIREGEYLGDLMAWSPIAVAANYELLVINYETGETLMERSGEDMAGLAINRTFFSGKYLYIDNETDSPVIDVTTGEQVSSGWTERPTEYVTPDWMLVLPYSAEGSVNECFADRVLPNRTGAMHTVGDAYACGDRGKLVHSPGGYDGQWF